MPSELLYTFDDGSTLTVGFDGYTRDYADTELHAQYMITIVSRSDFANGQEYVTNDLRGAEGELCNLPRAMSATAGFLTAAAGAFESATPGKPYSERENGQMFPEWVAEWASRHDHELTDLES